MPTPMTGLPVDPQHEAALARIASRLLSDPDVYLQWNDEARTWLLVNGTIHLNDESEWAAAVLVAAAAEKGIA